MLQQASVSVRHRSDLGSVTARSVIGRPQVAHVGQAQAGGQRLAVVQRLAKQHAGVEEQHGYVLRHLAGQVQQHRRFRAERADQGQPVAEGLVGLAQHGQRMGVAKFRIQPRRQVSRRRQRLGARLHLGRGLVVGHQPALSSNAT
jgi:hypothetical protein